MNKVSNLTEMFQKLEQHKKNVMNILEDINTCTRDDSIKNRIANLQVLLQKSESARVDVNEVSKVVFSKILSEHDEFEKALREHTAAFENEFKNEVTELKYLFLLNTSF